MLDNKTQLKLIFQIENTIGNRSSLRSPLSACVVRNERKPFYFLLLLMLDIRSNVFLLLDSGRGIGIIRPSLKLDFNWEISFGDCVINTFR